MTLGLTLIATIAFFAFVMRKVERDQLFDLEEEMVATGRTLAGVVVEELLAQDYDALQQILQKAQKASDMRLRLLDENRAIISDSYGEVTDRDSVRFRPEVQTAFAGSYQGYTRFADENQRSLALFIAIPIFNDQRVVGAVYLSRSTDDILQRLGQLRRAFTLWVGVLTGVLFLAAALITGNLHRTLRRLRRVPELEELELQPKDEVERVTESFNYLVSSLKQKIFELEKERDKTQRFVEDVAHELKTPITGLSGAVHALSHGEPDPRLLANVERETRRLSRLVSDLMELRKMEYYRLEPQPMELVSLVETTIENLSFEAERRELQLLAEVPEECVVRADPDKLQRVLENLVENALRCSPPGGRVTVSIELKEATATVVVKDTGPGVSEADKAVIFERAKGGSGPLGDLGLGLALVKEILSGHDSPLQVSNAESGGAIFSFELQRIVQPDESEAESEPQSSAGV